MPPKVNGMDIHQLVVLSGAFFSTKCSVTICMET